MVVTLVQVIHSDTTCPASKLKIKLFVQMAANRAQKVLKNTGSESNWTFGLTISSWLADGAGSVPSSYLAGIGEVDSCLVVLGRGARLEAMRGSGEGSSQTVRGTGFSWKTNKIDELHKVVSPIPIELSF